LEKILVYLRPHFPNQGRTIFPNEFYSSIPNQVTEWLKGLHMVKKHSVPGIRQLAVRCFVYIRKQSLFRMP